MNTTTHPAGPHPARAIGTIAIQPSAEVVDF